MSRPDSPHLVSRDVREHNLGLVLSVLDERGPLVRVELAVETRLPPSSRMEASTPSRRCSSGSMSSWSVQSISQGGHSYTKSTANAGRAPLRSVALRDLIAAPLLGLFLGSVWTIAGSTGEASLFAWVSSALGALGILAFNYVHRRTFDWYLANLWPGARRRTAEEEALRVASLQGSSEATAR